MNKLDLVISFDDTGSMSSVRKQVRSQITHLVEELFKLIPNLRIGIVIHNDYCDSDLVQKLELTDNKQKIIEFVGRSSSNGGGDYKEAYAYVLNQIRQFSWDAASKLAIVIADAEPHEKGARSAGVTELFDWKEESEELGKALIPIYSIQALGNRSAIPFYEGMARLSNGTKLDLSQFSHITDYILAIANKQSGTLDSFQDSKPEFKTNLAFRQMFNKLKGIADTVLSKEIDSKLEMLGKFQVVPVTSRIKIQDFVENMGLSYKRGKGYYQFIESEKIQANKEVIFVDKKTGETNFDTKWCREQMGVPYGTKATKSPKTIPQEVSRQYDIFIQSNSFTRLLDPGTKFLYELDKR